MEASSPLIRKLRILGKKPVALWLRRNAGLLLTLMAFASAIATYVAITGSSNSPLSIKPQRTLTLMFINVGVLLLLVGIVALRIRGLWNALRIDKAGSKLQKRILVLFSVVTIVPTLVVSIFSAVFFNLGIQTWFNDRVQTAVENSLVVAEAYLAEHKENIRGDAIAMAADLNRIGSVAIRDPQEYNEAVAAQATLRLLTEAVVFQRGHIIAQGRFNFALAFERIEQEIIDRASHGEVVIMTTDEDTVRALIKLDSPIGAYLLVGRPIDSKVITHMQSTQGAVSEYNMLKSQLDKLQITFMVIFITLALLLLLAAIWYGMVFAARLTTPISNIVVAAERVRGGDFDARVEGSTSKDEIGTLSRAFNRMTEQLQAQRSELIDANRRLDERRRFSEAVLSGVSAGVIALDKQKHITLFNRSSSAILSAVDLPLSEGTHINELLPGISELLAQAEHRHGEQADSTLSLSNDGKSITLHVRVSVEELGDEIQGFIVTFDDITLLVAAQRNAAWADVARRVAHEIKNPLTPIQLAAERLKRKYLSYVTDDQENFTRYTDTIIKNVADIGRMVEEFVSFARMPVATLKDEDLSAIVKKSIFTSQVACPTIEYTLDMPDESVHLMCDERQMTQVMTNLLKNAAESIESRPEGAPPGKIHVALTTDAEKIELRIVDNGAGFPEGEVKKVLEPYVTTRSKGTGLGLSIVKKIVEDHKGRIVLENISEGGALVLLSFSPHCDINASV